MKKKKLDKKQKKELRRIIEIITEVKKVIGPRAGALPEATVSAEPKSETAEDARLRTAREQIGALQDTVEFDKVKDSTWWQVIQDARLKEAIQRERDEDAKSSAPDEASVPDELANPAFLLRAKGDVGQLDDPKYLTRISGGLENVKEVPTLPCISTDECRKATVNNLKDVTSFYRSINRITRADRRLFKKLEAQGEVRQIGPFKNNLCMLAFQAYKDKGQRQIRVYRCSLGGSELARKPLPNEEKYMLLEGCAEIEKALLLKTPFLGINSRPDRRLIKEVYWALKNSYWVEPTQVKRRCRKKAAVTETLFK
jgi:hypothetical protein